MKVSLFHLFVAGAQFRVLHECTSRNKQGRYGGSRKVNKTADPRIRPSSSALVHSGSELSPAKDKPDQRSTGFRTPCTAGIREPPRKPPCVHCRLLLLLLLLFAWRRPSLQLPAAKHLCAYRVLHYTVLHASAGSWPSDLR